MDEPFLLNQSNIGAVMDPFDGDSELARELQRLVTQYRVQTIVETGTYRGETTRALGKMVPVVHTIEVKREFYDEAVQGLDAEENITVHLGSSPKVLRQLIPQLARPVLFFLDAHWERHWPLLDEMHEIAEAGLADSVVVIHDAVVPGRPELGYDQYYDDAGWLTYWIKRSTNKMSERWFGYTLFRRQKLDWEYVEAAALAINPLYKHHYNEQSRDGCRGVLFLTPPSEK